MPQTSLLLGDYLILTAGERAAITFFERQCRLLIDEINKNINLLSTYQPLYQRPNVADLYSILDSRKRNVLHTIQEKKAALYAFFSDNDNKVDLELIVRASLTSPALNTLLNDPLLNKFWNEVWRKCSRKSQKQEKDLEVVEYVPQSTQSSFELVKSLFIYGKYQLLVAEKFSSLYAVDYLNLASELGYFAALNAQIRFYLTQKDIKALACAEKAAKLYWTPGYLLLAVVHLESKNYERALFNLMMAECLRAYSKDMMINAYQCQDFDEICRPVMAKLNVRDWSQLEENLSSLARLAPNALLKLRLEADRQVKRILSKVKPHSEVDLLDLGISFDDGDRASLSSPL